jgi:UDP-glucose 4-epimerase
MTLLLTGATGFLGRALVPLLVRRDRVVALHRPGTHPPELNGVQWVPQDLAQPLTQDLPDRVDAVLHLAQSRRFREFPDGAVDVMAINVLATTRLLDYCRRAGGSTFLFASSGAVIGRSARCIREDDRPAPDTLYGVSKHAGEQAVAQYRSLFRCHALRYFFIYGPGQRSMMMPSIVERIASGEDVQLAGDDGISINPVYVDDAARATAGVLDLAEHSTINIAGPETVTIRELAEIIGLELGIEPRFARVPSQPDLVASIARMSNLLTPPTTTPQDGIRRTTAAYQGRHP